MCGRETAFLFALFQAALSNGECRSDDLARLFHSARAAHGRYYVTEVESETTIRAAFFGAGVVGGTSQ